MQYSSLIFILLLDKTNHRFSTNSNGYYLTFGRERQWGTNSGGKRWSMSERTKSLYILISRSLYKGSRQLTLWRIDVRN